LEKFLPLEQSDAGSLEGVGSCPESILGSFALCKG
jgi:hypothetical protein